MDNGRKRRRNIDHDEEENSQTLNFTPNPTTQTFNQSTLAVQTSSISPPGPGSQDYSYGYGEAGQYYGQFMQPGTLPCQVNYGQDPQQQQNIQQYSQLGSSSGYGLPTQAGYAQYGSVQQYPQRHSGTLGGIPNQYGHVPPYLVPGEIVSVSGPSSALSTRSMPTQYSQVLYAQPQQQQQPMDRTYMDPSLYASDPRQPRPSVAMTPEAAAQIAETQQDHIWQSYHTHLRQSFERIRDGKLSEAAQMLLDLSTWLLTNVKGLNLIYDTNARRREERLKLWGDFNNAWLALLQKQKDVSQQELEAAGQQPPDPQTRISSEFLEKIGDELIDLCTKNLEPWGLVDYQAGVWEEQIIDVLKQCRILGQQLDGRYGAEPITVSGPSSAATSGHSAAPPRRR